jgi:hypothetical protein
MALRVQFRIGVAAPASAVWAVISDLEGWAGWNPLYPAAEGRLSIGSLLTLRRELDCKSEGQEVKVVDWVPNEQLLWSRSIAPFARSLGFIEIEALTERGCILSAGELYRGLIGDQIGKRNGRKLKAGFRGLCEAAKARAEATWDGTPDEPVPPPPPPPPPKMRTGFIQLSLRGARKK